MLATFQWFGCLATGIFEDGLRYNGLSNCHLCVSLLYSYQNTEGRLRMVRLQGLTATGMKVDAFCNVARCWREYTSLKRRPTCIDCTAISKCSYIGQTFTCQSAVPSSLDITSQVYCGPTVRLHRLMWSQAVGLYHKELEYADWIHLAHNVV
jgi:hypothetical protein